MKRLPVLLHGVGVWLVSLAGVTYGICCGAEAASAPPVQTLPESHTNVEPRVAPTSPRHLQPSATYGDLVSLVIGLDERGLGDSTAGCLVRPQNGLGFELEADLSLGTKPLPEVPEDLDSTWRSACDGVQFVTAWGVHSDGARNSFGVVAMTYGPAPSDAATLVAVTDQKVYVRSAEGCIEATEREALSRAGDGPIYLIAERSTPVTKIQAVLAGAGPTSHVVLAIGSANVALRANQEEALSLCPDGLPHADAPEGDRTMHQIFEGLQSLRPQFERCPVSPDRTVRAVVAFRIAADGRVTHACIVDAADSTPEVRACALDAIRDALFPPANGIVDAHFPLTFRAEPATDFPSPLCQ